MDLLSDILEQSGLKSSILKRCIESGPWSNSFFCDRSMEFHVVTYGQIFLKSPVIKDPIRLNRGDIVLFSRGTEHELTTNLKLQSQKVSVRPENDLDKISGNIQLISGHYEFFHTPIHPFFKDVPDFFVIRSETIASHEPLHAALQLLSLETTKPKLGSGLIAKSLVDIVFGYLLQRLIEEQNVESKSWSSAAKDPQVNKALNLMHEQWARAWTVEQLAVESGLSRAGLALKFKSLMGESPLRYLAVLRTQRAIELLTKTDQSLDLIAQSVGYSDGFSFSKMFKRVTGKSPREFRKMNKMR